LIVDLTDTGVSPVELLQAIVRGNNASHPTSAQREAAS
jgi:hypothetical protein